MPWWRRSAGRPPRATTTRRCRRLAGTCSREDLPRVEQLLRIPQALEALLPVDDLGRLLPRHVARLRDADAVLARERAAQIERRAEHAAERALDARRHGRVAVVLVGEDVDVQVAVARVPEGGRHEPLPGGDAVDLLEHGGDGARRYDDVLRQLEGVRLAQRARAAAPRGPEALSIGVVARDDDVGGAVVLADAAAPQDIGLHALRLAVELHEHERARARGEREGRLGPDVVDRVAIHELERARAVAFLDDGAHGAARRHGVGHDRDERADGL